MLRYGALALLIGAPSFAATPAFYKDVLPIYLAAELPDCHRAGEIGPMAFIDYRNTRPWAKSIKAAVLTKKMPPWFADAKYGRFANDRRLKNKKSGRWRPGRTRARLRVTSKKSLHLSIGKKAGASVRMSSLKRHSLLQFRRRVQDYAYIVFPTGF